jgi:hypothetical protein
VSQGSREVTRRQRKLGFQRKRPDVSSDLSPRTHVDDRVGADSLCTSEWKRSIEPPELRIEQTEDVFEIDPCLAPSQNREREHSVARHSDRIKSHPKERPAGKPAAGHAEATARSGHKGKIASQVGTRRRKLSSQSPYVGMIPREHGSFDSRALPGGDTDSRSNGT